jgi:hypothetical protein
VNFFNIKKQQIMTTETQTSTMAADTAAPTETAIQGRSVFMVETTAQGVAVQTAFAAADGRMLQLPAMFPDVDYAYAQIDELRRLVGQHFAQAAQVGAQVIAAQMAQQQQAAAAEAAATDITKVSAKDAA